MPPEDFSKQLYKQAKKDNNGQNGSCPTVCHTCKEAPSGVKLLKCSQCLSVSYCSKDCQRKDWKSHKKCCQELYCQRKNSTIKEVDQVANTAGCPNIPWVWISLPASLTGLRDNVLCLIPLWTFQYLDPNQQFQFLPPSRRSYDAKKLAKSVKYFFKTFQISATAMKNTSPLVVGDMVMDSAMLVWARYPGVRRVKPEEYGTGQWCERFCTLDPPPVGWKLQDYENVPKVARVRPGMRALMEHEMEQLRQKSGGVF